MALGGLLVPFLGLVGMMVFSVSLFFNLSLVMLWLYLELSGLCLIPLFFSDGALVSFSGLFYYIIFSGVSSGFLLLGVLLPECFFFILVGFLMKFGVFPLWGWVYRVCGVSSWVVIWGFSTVLKVSFFLFPLFMVLSGYHSTGVIFLCAMGCFLLSFMFWVFVYDWKLCWCHIMLSSSSVLVGLSISGVSSWGLLGVYLFYFFWSSLVINFLACGDSTLGYPLSSGIKVFYFCFLLLTVPVSLPIFYKILICCCIFSSGFLLLFCWALYSFSEQVYLLLFLTGFYSHGVVCESYYLV